MLAAGSGVRGRTLFEEQLPLVVGGVAADVLLDVRVLVVVDADALVPRGQTQPADQAGLTHRGLALDQDRVTPAGDTAVTTFITVMTFMTSRT